MALKNVVVQKIVFLLDFMRLCKYYIHLCENIMITKKQVLLCELTQVHPHLRVELATTRRDCYATIHLPSDALDRLRASGLAIHAPLYAAITEAIDSRASHLTIR